MKNFQSLQAASGKKFQSLEATAPEFSSRWNFLRTLPRFCAAGLTLGLVVASDLRAQAPAAAAPAATAAAAAKESPPEQIDAYVALIQADQARDRGNWKTALQQYREAMKQYALLLERHPNWNPEIVSFRLSYCANEVAAILKKSGKTETEILMGPALTAEDENASYKDRFDALKRDFEKVREEAAQLRKDGAMNEAVAKNIQAEAKRLERDNNRLRLELTGSSNLAQRNADEVVKLKQDITQLKLQIDEGLLANQKTLREKQAAERAKEEAERTTVELSKDLADTRRMNSDFEGRNGILMQQLDEAKKSLADRETKLAAATNEIVRSAQVNVKLQEEIKATGKLDVEKYKKELELAKIESDLLNRKLAAALKDAETRGDAVGLLMKDKRTASNELAAARLELATVTRQRDLLDAEIARNKKALAEHVAVVTMVAEQKQQIAVLTQQLATAEKARDAMSAAAGGAGKVQTQLNEANAEIAKQKITIAKLEQSVANVERARDEALSLAGAAAKIQAKLAEATNTIAQQKAEVAALERKVAVAETARDNALSLSGQAGKLQTKLNEANLQIDQQTAEAKRLKSESAAAKAVAEKAADDARTAMSALAKEQSARAQAERDARLNSDAVAKLTQENKALTSAKPINPAEVQKLQDALTLARDDVRNWSARHESLSNTLDGVKKRMAEMSADALARDRKAAATDTEMAALKKSHSENLSALTAAQKRTADFEEQVRTVAAARVSDLDKQKKHIAALNETIELNQKEMERLRSEAKKSLARIEQLENDNRLLQNENARLKK